MKLAPLDNLDAGSGADAVLCAVDRLAAVSGTASRCLAADLHALCDQRRAQHAAALGLRPLMPALVSVDTILEVLRRHGQ